MIPSSRLRWSLSIVPCLVLAAGCDHQAKGPAARAILRMSRQPDERLNEYRIRQETHAALIKSDFVLRAALRDPVLQQHQDLSVDSLANALDIQRHDDELIHLSLSMAPATKAATVLDKIIESYLAEIVSKERLGKVDALAKLRKRYAMLQKELKERTDEFNELGGDHPFGYQTLSFTNEKLLELELQRVELQHAEAEQDLAVNAEQIQLLKTRLVQERANLASTSGDLEARQADLTALRLDVAQVRAEMQKVELELDGPDPITVVQRATLQ